MSSSGALAAASMSGSRGIVALLDLPPGTSLTVDGSTHAIRRDDFCGVSEIPSEGFHLVVVSSSGQQDASWCPSLADAHGDGSSNDETDRRKRSISKPSSLHTTGFLFMRTNGCDGMLSDSDCSDSTGWIVARRYNAQTEEISSEPVDDLTATNLRKAIGGGRIGPQCVVPYERFLTQPIEKWGELTSSISSSLLKRRNITSGGKIVPGAYDEDSERDSGRNMRAENTNIDGQSVCYPPIPCVEAATQSSSVHLARTAHVGTKKYLSQLSPSDRTELFLDAEPGSKILHDVLETYYDGKWQEVIGDIELSFLLFLYLGCLSSFEHWRDLISMLSFAGPKVVTLYTDLYTELLRSLARHLEWIEEDFFDEVEYSSGNFLVPALSRFLALSSQCGDGDLMNASNKVKRVVKTRFGIDLVSHLKPKPSDRTGQSNSSLNENSDDGEEEIMEIDVNVGDGSTIDLSAATASSSAKVYMGRIDNAYNDDFVDDDDDGPVIVSEEDLEASLARSAAATISLCSVQTSSTRTTSADDQKNRSTYPLIFAAMTPQEDILMTCARVLDEAKDVSLVREAAAYLEDVESKHTPFC